jgi:hypothetical protein
MRTTETRIYNCITYLQWSCPSDARGLDIDYKQAVGEDIEDISDDNHSDVGDKHDLNKHDINFIYQFLVGSPTGIFEEFERMNNEEKLQDYEDADLISDVIPASSPVLLKPTEYGINERQNKVFWTDEELEAGGGKQVAMKDTGATEDGEEFIE